MQQLRRLAFLTLSVVALAGATAATTAQGAVGPGSETNTEGAGQCTANFVFNGSGGAVYIGQAAHCAGTGGPTETDGCDSGSLPLGTRVEIEGASRPGELAYSSWLTMQEKGEQDPDTCAFNDFALIKINPADHGAVDPTVPVLGGPTGLTDTVGGGTQVFSYGNSSLRLGLDLLKPKFGVSLGQDAGGWNHTVLTVTPGIPGDSGSGFLDDEGRAFGVLSTVQLAPLPAANGVGDLSRELRYANEKAGLGVTLTPGTRPFAGIGLGAASESLPEPARVQDLPKSLLSRLDSLL